jgi:hypothetical protein
MNGELLLVQLTIHQSTVNGHMMLVLNVKDLGIVNKSWLLLKKSPLN